MTILSFGGGQDSTAILYKILYDPIFRSAYVKGQLLVVMADTKNEHDATNEHVQEIAKLLEELKIPFFFITGEMGYTSPSWQKGLVEFYRSKKAIGSKCFPKTCTDKLKITPIYNWLDDYISKQYGFEKGYKRAIKAYAEKYGKIRVLIGIAADEEKRIAKNDAKTPVWMRLSIEKYFPLVDINYDRAACQDYIVNVVNKPLPPPSNCKICPFMSLQELLWLYRNDPASYWEWVELEKAKIENNSHLDPKKNLGVWGIKLLPQVLEEAIQKFGHMSNTELDDYKMSHGHCVTSSY